jgi:DNA-binding transcriptional LysR family regulator
MDLEGLGMFVKVAELSSFTRAAEQLGIPKARVSARVQALEADVGSRLLQRTTRAVRLTPDGEQFLARAKRLVLEAEEIGGMFRAPSGLRGRLRIDMPVGFARDFVLPRLPEFLAAHPQLEVLLSVTDRRVEVVREGFDCVVRVGELADSALFAQRLGVVPMANYASQAYLRKHGVPRTVEDLDAHLLVHYSQALGAEPPTFEYRDGATYRERPMRSLVTVNGSEAYTAACAAGLGIIQVPRASPEKLAANGLVEILHGHTCKPMPVSLVHAHGRNVPKRVRAVMTWLRQVIDPALAGW